MTINCLIGFGASRMMRFACLILSDFFSRIINRMTTISNGRQPLEVHLWDLGAKKSDNLKTDSK